MVIQLDGGNDGINTVVPCKDEGYARARQALRLPANQLHKISSEVGLHPAMRDAAKLLESGRLAIVQGVGYPNPNRSHFKSTAIWQCANVSLPRSDDIDAQTNASFGWIGQTLDRHPEPADGMPGAVFLGNGSLPLALRSRRSVASALTRPEDATVALKSGGKLAALEADHGDDLTAFVRRSTLDAYAASRRMAEVLRVADQGVGYPATILADRLRVIARLIKGGVGTRSSTPLRVATILTICSRKCTARLLAELSGALKAFLDDLAGARLAERVLVLCFSEFGRRVAENNSQGTDHGTAGPVFLAGPGVKAGLVGTTPSLTDLVNGDLKMGLDFRCVYASVLEDWLGSPSEAALAGRFARLPLFSKT